MIERRVKKIVKILIIGILALTTFGFLVMVLWNWLAPPILGAHTINFWQALGILALSKILFGGFHKHGGHWNGRMGERWAQMTPEEREKLRQAMASRCGRAGVEAK
jgi:hypothetical protein